MRPGTRAARCCSGCPQRTNPSASPATSCSPGRSAAPTCPAATATRCGTACATASCRSPTRPSCCPGTVRRPRSARSARATPSCVRSPRQNRVRRRAEAGDLLPMAKPTPLSGFPEWLPGEQLIEQQFLDRIRRTFELHGFTPIETRAVEPLDQLLRKGETSKEVYLLRRLQAATDGAAGAAGAAGAGAAGADGAADAEQLGLHFDLTVPFARYVLENAGKLQFPFRRYQIQRVWRGERPQEGRYREFRQADIDVVDRDTLAAHYDYELPIVAAEALAGLPIPPVVVHTSNRKLAQGFYQGLGIDDPPAVLRVVDKLDKIGPARVVAELVDPAGLTDAQAKACLALAEIATDDASFADAVRRLGV